MSIQLKDALVDGTILSIKKGGTGAPEEVTNLSEVQQEIVIHAAEPIDKAVFNTAASAPAHQEGTIFWDAIHKAISGQCEVDGVVINYGFEDLIRVYNQSGATILNGKPCKATGVNSSEHLPLIELAQADNYTNSELKGVATHDIPDMSIGYLAVRGGVHDIDMSAFSVGDVLYLSDTVAGGYTTTPPDIATRIGEVRKNGALDGAMFVDLNSNIELPTVFGRMYETGDVYALTTIFQNIVDYDQEDSIVCPVDIVNGIIAPEYSGLFRTSFTINLSFSSSVSSRTIYLRLYDVTAGAEVASIDTAIPVARDITQVSRSMQLPHQVIANHEYSLQISASTAMSVTVDDLSFDMQSIRIS